MNFAAGVRYGKVESVGIGVSEQTTDEFDAGIQVDIDAQGTALNTASLCDGNSFVHIHSPCRHLVWTVLEQGNPQLTWNCFHELTQLQVQTMTKRPYMAHQYARRIADLWQRETGGPRHGHRTIE